MNFDRYYRAKVFVTGHVGFKGRHLVRRLREIGATVLGYDIAAPSGIERGNVEDGWLLGESIERFEPDFIFHLAAQAFVPVGFEKPLRTFETNTIGTVNLLEALRLSKIDRCAVVVVTTDKVYGESRRESDYAIPFPEDYPLTPHCPYSASKIAAEHAIAAYRDAYWRDGKIAVATARAGNVIGPGDWGTGRLIPNAVKALQSGLPASCYNPSAVRPWQHIDDVIDGYLRLGTALAREGGSNYASAWNFGPDEHHTVRTVLDLVCRAWGPHATWATVRTTLHEVSELRIDSTRARRYLDWKPKWTFEEMIDSTIRWYKSLETR